MDPRKAVPAAVVIAALVAIALAGPRDGATGGSVGVSAGSTITDAGSTTPLPIPGGGGDVIQTGCQPPDCDDGNECTLDMCLPTGSKTNPTAFDCVHTPISDTPCEGDGYCEDGVCMHAPAGCKTNSECDDKDPCTADACVSGQCLNSNMPNCCKSDAQCDDGLECTDDTCLSMGGSALVGGGQCMHTSKDGQSCSSDGNDCTQDICVGSECENLPTNKGSCDDGDDCTSGDYCSNGDCVGGQNVCTCDDAGDCKARDCQKVECVSQRCEYDDLPDGIACGFSEQCRSGACQNGDCKYVDKPDGTECTDSNECTAGDVCEGGECVPGTQVCRCQTKSDCDPAPECQVVYCNNFQCDYKPAPSSTACDDGDGCTSGDHCSNGACMSGEFTCECQTNSDCTAVTCKSALCKDGNCEYSNIPDGTACDDGNDCTEGDVCNAGTCDGQNACECERDGDCDDDDDATEDSCVRNVCVHEEIGENETAGVTGEEEIPIVEYEEANLTVALTVYPAMTLYQPGDRLRSVTALVKLKGEPVEGANVSGRLESIEPKNLSFSDEGGGYYSADIGYVIPGDENAIVPLAVEASAGGDEATETERLLIDVEGDFLLMVNNPASGSEVAPGEDVAFEGEVGKKRSTDRLSGVQVWLIDERTDEEFPMAGEGQVYSKDYTIPKNVRENAYFLMLARANVNGEQSETAERISLTKASELHVEFDRSQQDVKKGKIALIIRYSDEEGDQIRDSRVSARITGYPSGVVQELELVLSGGVFLGNYKRDKRDNSAEIEVGDSYGNSGKAVLPPEFFEEVGSFEIPWDLITLSGIAAVVAIGAFLLSKALIGRHASHNVEMKLLLGRKAQLEDLVKQTKSQFYRRQIDEETANKQIREYEESLATVNKRLAGMGKVPEIHAPIPPPGTAQASAPENSPAGSTNSPRGI